MQRRSRRRLAIAVIVLLTFPAWYVAAWLLLAMGFTRGYVSQAYGPHVAVPFRPLIAYASSDSWGSETLRRLYCTAIWENFQHVHPAPVPSEEDDLVFVQIGPLSPMITMSLCRKMQAEHAARE